MEKIFDFNYDEIHKPKFGITCKGCNQSMIFFWRNRRQPLARHLQTQKHKDLVKNTSYSNISLSGLNADTSFTSNHSPTKRTSMSYLSNNNDESDSEESLTNDTNEAQNETLSNSSLSVCSPQQRINDKKLKRMEQELKLYKTDCEILQKDKECLTEQNELLKKHLEEYKKMLKSSTKSLREELEKCHKEQNELEKKYSNIKNESKLLKGENEALKDEIDRLSKENLRFKNSSSLLNDDSPTLVHDKCFNLITKFFEQMKSNFEINLAYDDQIKVCKTAKDKLKIIENEFNTLRCCLVTRFKEEKEKSLKEKADLMKKLKNQEANGHFDTVKIKQESNGTPLTPDEINEFKEKHLNSFITRVRANKTLNIENGLKRQRDDSDVSQSSGSELTTKRSLVQVPDTD